MSSSDNSKSFDAILKAETILRNRYIIGEFISDKGFSRIYKGQNNHNSKDIVIKELIPDVFLAPDLKKQVLEQFQTEVKILLNLLHSTLPKFEDYFEIDGKRYLVMEYIYGEKLESFVRNHKGFIDQYKAITWAIELCDVLEYLHTRHPKPIIFRSLCPDNIIITPDGNLKLIDFGVSKLFDPEDITLPIAKTSNKHYSPIEQSVGTTDERTDIYSLGATLYYILTKEVPLDAAQRSLSQKSFLPCRDFNPEISLILEKIIFRTSEIEPDKRYQKIGSLKSALQKVRANLQPVFTPPENIKKENKTSVERDEGEEKTREEKTPDLNENTEKASKSEKPGLWINILDSIINICENLKKL